MYPTSYSCFDDESGSRNLSQAEIDFLNSNTRLISYDSVGKEVFTLYYILRLICQNPYNYFVSLEYKITLTLHKYLKYL